MFGAKKKKDNSDNAGVMQKSARGNMDEYEALRTIVAENAGLLTRVLDKIRVQRTLSGLPKKGEVTIEDTGKERQPERAKKGEK